MEIHAPHKPIGSVKEFLVHIFTITVGILIAFGLEEAAAAYHHHEMGESARASIVSELRDNAKSLDARLKDVVRFKEEHQHVISVVNTLIARKAVGEESLVLTFGSPTLTSTSWTTAQSLGALAYMDYADVKQFSGLYEMQNEVLKVQDDLSRAVSAALADLVGGSDPEDLTVLELKDVRRLTQRSLAQLGIWEQVGQQLAKQYAAVLKEK